jgi:hypothetical protein
MIDATFKTGTTIYQSKYEIVGSPFVLFRLTIVLSVLQLTVFDYPCGIFKHFFF